MLYLASQSPRRRELLQQLGAAFQVLTLEVPELPRHGEAPPDYVRRVARDKALAGLASLDADVAADAQVIGSDTEVVLDGVVFGKPADAADAVAMLRRLSARTHTVLSAVWLVSPRQQQCALSTSQVRFDALDDARIASYVATGEPFGRAGGYAIQGLGAAFVAHLEGSYSGVMGLPLFETAQLLHAAADWPVSAKR
jgi:septum formation protein